jgi:hypothetical protein
MSSAVEQFLRLTREEQKEVDAFLITDAGEGGKLIQP